MSEVGPILLATDGSPSAQEAQREAIRLARVLEVPLVAVSVAHVVPPAFGAAGFGYSSVVAELTRAEHERIESLLAEVGQAAEAEGVPCTTVSADGPVVEEICRQASECDAQLIVTGSHGWGAARRMLSGSVSSGLVHSAPCPVLVVRPRAETRRQVASA